MDSPIIIALEKHKSTLTTKDQMDTFVKVEYFLRKRLHHGVTLITNPFEQNSEVVHAGKKGGAGKSSNPFVL
jgi:hypothetical protein